MADDALWFGATEKADGPVHSNAGIRMDGDSNSDVTSLNNTYNPSSRIGGDGNSHPGVWCAAGTNCTQRNATNDNGAWRYPVPSVDFGQLTGSLCNMKKVAFTSDPATQALAGNANACTLVPTTKTPAYLPQTATNGSFSTVKGYLIQLYNDASNKPVYDVSLVNAENDRLTPYTSALTTQAITGGTGVGVPTSGVIFAEDNVWVRTKPNFHGRVTIAAGRLASNSSANIVIADDVAYTAKDGTDAIGLVAENSVFIAPYAPPATGNFNFEVDAALLAEAGNVMFGENDTGTNGATANYRTNNDNNDDCVRGWVNPGQTFNFYGSVATRQTWTWTWLVPSGCGDSVKDTAANQWISGIENNTTSYDYQMLYAPPPSYPTATSFNILSWREVVNHP